MTSRFTHELLLHDRGRLLLVAASRAASRTASAAWRGWPSRRRRCSSSAPIGCRFCGARGSIWLDASEAWQRRGELVRDALSLVKAGALRELEPGDSVPRAVCHRALDQPEIAAVAIRDREQRAALSPSERRYLARAPPA